MNTASGNRNSARLQPMRNCSMLPIDQLLLVAACLPIGALGARDTRVESHNTMLAI